LKLDRYRLAGLPYGPPSRPFATVDEIGLVAGMSADLLSRLRRSRRS
jgi:type II secretory pathway component PulK